MGFLLKICWSIEKGSIAEKESEAAAGLPAEGPFFLFCVMSGESRTSVNREANDRCGPGACLQLHSDDNSLCDIDFWWEKCSDCREYNVGWQAPVLSYFKGKGKEDLYQSVRNYQDRRTFYNKNMSLKGLIVALTNPMMHKRFHRR